MVVLSAEDVRLVLGVLNVVQVLVLAWLAAAYKANGGSATGLLPRKKRGRRPTDDGR